MKEATAYLPKDAIANHRDFDVYYADGTPFLGFQGAWQRERTRSPSSAAWEARWGASSPTTRLSCTI